MHTVKEAADLWCPMVRYQDDAGAPSGNRDEVSNSGSFGRWNACVASRCAMWRWSGEPPARQRFAAYDSALIDEPERPAHVPASLQWHPYDDSEGDPAQWVEDDASANARRRGYCGLAGGGPPY